MSPLQQQPSRLVRWMAHNCSIPSTLLCRMLLKYSLRVIPTIPPMVIYHELSSSPSNHSSNGHELLLSSPSNYPFDGHQLTLSSPSDHPFDDHRLTLTVINSLREPFRPFFWWSSTPCNRLRLADPSEYTQGCCSVLPFQTTIFWWVFVSLRHLSPNKISKIKSYLIMS